MKALVVFYSRSGNTRRVAEAIASAMEAPMEELHDLRSRAGLIGWLRAGFDASRGAATMIAPTREDTTDYDLIIIGTPVWAGRMTPAVRTYLLQERERLEKVAFFASCDSGNADAAFAEMRELIEREPYATVAVTSAEVKDGGYTQQVGMFVHELLS